MDAKDFNELINGPLSHPLITFRVMRLILALKDVIDATGEQGEEALRSYCKLKQRQDDDLEGERGDPADYENPHL